MAVAMIGPKFYAWDRNGKPLAFGKLYTYQARTNTPKPTYQSEDQVVENTNPVILNGEGYANVYLDGSYKVVLKDSDDNEIWSADPVTASQAEEWSDCMPAAYNSPNSFVVAGNLTTTFDVGRRVRLEQGGSEYQYASVFDSSYAGGFTTVVLTQSVVTVSINEACVSIVGRDTLNVSSYSPLAFDSVQKVKDEVTTGGEVVSITAGMIIKTSGRISSGDGGASDYVAVTSSQYATLVGNSNGPAALENGGDGTVERFDFTIKADLVAYKLRRDVVFTEQLADMSSPSDVAGAFVAAAFYGSRLYHFKADVESNFITIDGATRPFSIDGHGGIRLSNNQDNMCLRIDNCTGFTSVKNISIDGNKFNQNPASRNFGAGLRFFNCQGGYEAIRVNVSNNHSGAAILVIDNASDTEEYDAQGEIAFCRIRNAGDGSFAFSSDGIFVNSDRSSIHNNDIDGVTDFAIAFDYCQKTKAYQNVCKNFLVGAGIVGAKDFEMFSNVFDKGELGIDVTLAGNPAQEPYISERVKIHNNTVLNIDLPTSLTGNAISVDPATIKAEVYDNTVDTFSGVGVACTANGAKVYDNNVFGNAGQTAYFIGGVNTRFVDNSSDDGTGKALIHNIASSLTVIDDKNSSYQRTSRTVTPSIGSATRLAYLRATSNDAAAILSIRIAQNFAGIGKQVIERRLRCEITSGTFSFSELSIVGDTTVLVTASPLASGQAHVTVNVPSGTQPTVTAQLELVSMSDDGSDVIYLTDRL